MIEFSESQIEYIVAQYRKGYTLKEIGIELNVSRTPIKKVLIKHCPEYEGKKRISTSFIRPDTTKECPKCHQIKLLSEYNKGNGMYGRRSICRECEQAIQNTPERRKRIRSQQLFYLLQRFCWHVFLYLWLTMYSSRLMLPRLVRST